MFFKRLPNLFHALVSFLIDLFLPNRILIFFCNINSFLRMTSLAYTAHRNNEAANERTV